MKIQSRKMIRYTFFRILIFFLLFCSASLAFAAPSRVAILPFDINEKVFGRVVTQRPAVANAPQSGKTPATHSQPAPRMDDQRMHPEKLLLSGAQDDTQAPATGQPSQIPNPAFVATERASSAKGQRTYWKSRNFKTLINGIDVADVDNDGKLEVVMATEKLVAIYRVENQRLVKVAEAAQTRNSSYIAVDVADINGNKTPEIYVTSLGSKRSIVDSFVLEYNGTDYGVIHKKDNWYYRVANTIDRGTLLLGQRQRLSEESIFNNPIHEMQWEGDRLVPGPQLLQGRKANLMGVAYGDITQSGQSRMIGYSTSDRLRIYDPASEVIWEDSDRSGGNMAYFLLPKVDPGVENKQFFPLRIRITDIDRDGKSEVLVARHDELMKNLTRDFRRLRKGQLESRVWDGLTLPAVWKTQEFPGRASDFLIADFDNDGMDELVVALVSKEGAIIFTDALSSIIAFDLQPPPQ